MLYVWHKKFVRKKKKEKKMIQTINTQIVTTNFQKENYKKYPKFQ